MWWIRERRLRSREVLNPVVELSEGGCGYDLLPVRTAAPAALAYANDNTGG